MPNQTATNLDTALAALRKTYVERIASFIPNLENFLILLRNNTLHCEHAEELGRLAHNFAGGGGTFGFHTISDAGYALEEAVTASLEGEFITPAHQQQLESLLQQLIDECKEAIEKEL